MSTKYKFYNPSGTYFVTFAVVGWVDVFTRDEYRNIIIDSFNYCVHKKGLVIHTIEKSRTEGRKEWMLSIFAAIGNNSPLRYYNYLVFKYL